MRITVELNCDQVDDIVRNVLIEQLNYEENDELIEAISKVIAYFSIPNTWNDGKYDIESDLK